MESEGSWSFSRKGAAIVHAKFELAEQAGGRRQSLVESIAGPAVTPELWEQVLINAFVSTTEAKDVESLEIHFTDFHRSIGPVVAWIADVRLPNLVALFLGFAGFDTRVGISRYALSTTGEKLIYPASESDGELNVDDVVTPLGPLVSASISRRFCSATWQLRELTLVGCYIFDELHHESLQRLHAKGWAVVAGCGVVDYTAGQGANLPALKTLHRELPYVALSGGFNADQLDLDPQRLPALRCLDLSGSDFAQTNGKEDGIRGLIDSLVDSPILKQLETLRLPFLKENDCRKILDLRSSFTKISMATEGVDARLESEVRVGLASMIIETDFDQVTRMVALERVEPITLTESNGAGQIKVIDSLLPDVAAAREYVALLRNPEEEVFSHLEQRTRGLTSSLYEAAEAGDWPTYREVASESFPHDPLPKFALQRLGRGLWRPGIRIPQHNFGPRYLEVLGHASREFLVRVIDSDTNQNVQVFRFPAQKGIQQLKVAISNDGTLVVAGGCSSEVTVFDVAAGEVRWRFRGMSDKPVADVAFSPDGKSVAAGDEDGVVRVWSVAKGIEEACIEGAPVSSLAFSVASDLLLVGTSEGRALLLRWRSQTEVMSFEDHSGPVLACAISADNRSAATCELGDQVRPSKTHLWNLQSGREVATIVGEDGPSPFDGFSYQNGLLVTDFRSNREAGARYWDPQKGRELSRFEHLGRLNSVEFSPDNRKILTGGTVTVWDANSGEPIRCLGQSVHGLACFSPDGSTIAAQIGEALSVYDAGTYELIDKLDHQSRQGFGVTFAPNGDLIVGVDQEIWRWDLTAMRPRWRQGVAKAWATNLAISPDGKWIACGSSGANIALIDASVGRLVKTICAFDRKRLSALCFSESSSALFVASNEDKKLFEWNLTTSEGKHWDIGGNRSPQSLAMLPSTNELAVGFFHGDIRIFDVTTMKPSLFLEDSCNLHNPNALDFSTDGRLASAGRDRTVVVWAV